jgi:hypothetical protein
MARRQIYEVTVRAAKNGYDMKMKKYNGLANIAKTRLMTTKAKNKCRRSRRTEIQP